MATTSSTPQPSQQAVTPQKAAEGQRTPIGLGRESGGILVLLIFIAALILTTNDFLMRCVVLCHSKGDVATGRTRLGKLLLDSSSMLIGSESLKRQTNPAAGASR
jgi:hypothetical protein